jgi:hypothetical protein
MAELRLILSHVVRYFHILNVDQQTREDLQLRDYFLLRPEKRELFLSFKRRVS